MAGSTTVYDVVTRYRTEHGAATGGTRQYRTEVDGLSRSLGSAQAMAGAVFVGLSKFVGLAGGMASVGFAVHAGITRTFRNLNEELNSSLALAAQLNLAFNFAGDPAENFRLSLGAARGLMSDLTRDAARLPGELSDFVGIARQISGAVFGGGGDIGTLRGLTARVALAAPAAGQSPDDAARQTMRALFGTASVGDNPLFAMMLGSRLFGPGMTAESFNKLPAAERLQKFDEALAKLTDNPMFRSEVIRTFDTQLGTLADNLFGINGIISQVGGREAFDAVLDGLVSLNQGIERNVPTIVSGMAQLRGEIEFWADAVKRLWYGMATGAGLLYEVSPLGNLGTPGEAAGKGYELLLKNPYDAARALAGTLRNGELPTLENLQKEMHRADMVRMYTDLAARNARKSARGLPLDESGIVPPPNATPTPAVTHNTVHQTNYIQVDLKSDDSPEAVAVKLGKAMEIAEKHPRRSSRALSLLPTSRALE